MTVRKVARVADDTMAGRKAVNLRSACLCQLEDRSPRAIGAHDGLAETHHPTGARARDEEAKLLDLVDVRREVCLHRYELLLERIRALLVCDFARVVLVARVVRRIVVVWSMVAGGRRSCD